MSKTTADVIGEARQYLDGPTRGVLNQVNGALDASQTTVPLTYTPGTTLALGDVLSVDLEVMYVWSYDAGTKTATVRRGHDGSTAASHAGGALVRINPKFTDFAIFSAANNAINGMASANMWQPKTLDRTVNAIVDGYDLASDMVGDGILEVSFQPLGLAYRKEWVRLTRYEIMSDISTVDYPSGKAIMIPIGQTGAPLRIVYKAVISNLVSLADDVQAVTGLPVTALDLPALGGAANLQDGLPTQRANFMVQPGSRVPGEVNTTDVLQSGGALRAKYNARLAQEVRALSKGWATRQRTSVM